MIGRHTTGRVRVEALEAQLGRARSARDAAARHREEEEEEEPRTRAMRLLLSLGLSGNPLGAKGAGEGEIIPVGGVIANAVAQALAGFGVEPMALPLSPSNVWRMLQEAIP